MLLSFLVLQASAAEVVWLSPPSAEDAARVAALAGAQRGPLTLLDLRAATAEPRPADDAAWKDLARVLQEVRSYETRLDGELLILRDLEVAINRLRILRDDADRSVLHTALAYQGFAADRYFGDRLATDEEAIPWQVELNGAVVERPWRDAAALEPGQTLGAHQVPEAPQRLAYEAVLGLSKDALPASLVFKDLAPGSEVLIDARPVQPGPAGDIKLPPGKHYVTLLESGRVVDTWVVMLADTDQSTLVPSWAEGSLEAWLAGTAPAPDAMALALDALGGEVWIAQGAGAEVVVRAATAQGLTEVDVPIPKVVVERASGPTVGLAAIGGWLSSGNLYTDDPSRPRTVGTVNPALLGLAVDAGVDLGLFRAVLAVDGTLTPGTNHAVVYGPEGATSGLRPSVQAAVGLRYVQVSGGYLFPHHPVVGLRGQVDFDGLELRAGFGLGLPGQVQRETGPDWERLAALTAHAGVGWRFGPR